MTSSTIRIIPRTRVDQLGEGPLWSARHQALFWVDIIGRRLNRLALADGAVTSWELPLMTGWVIERAGGDFVIGTQAGVHTLALDPFALALLCHPEADKPLNRMNDAKADAQGRIFAGSMAIAIDGPSGSLWRIDPDGGTTELDRDYTIANGPAISPDGRWLFYTDSALGQVYRFALHADGTLGPRTLWRQFGPGEGKPDGMTFDRDGGLWVACWGAGRVARFHPDATLDTEIRLPASQISSCCFAGPGIDRMFVTSAAVDVDEPAAGALFEVDTGRIGLAPHMFGG